MSLSRKENSALQRVFKCMAPEVYLESMTEISKIRSKLDVHRVPVIKQAFDACGFTDSRLFLAVIFKKYHPAMYQEDNRNLTLKQGLCKSVAECIGMKESNCSNLFKEVRAWLKYDQEELRTRLETAFPLIESKLLTLNQDRCKPCLFE